MKRIDLLLVSVAIVAGVVTAWAPTSTGANADSIVQRATDATPSAKQIRGATPYPEIKNDRHRN